MKEISAKEVEQRLANGEKLNIIDVREVMEVHFGHIPGVKNISLGSLPSRINELSKSEQYIMVCRSGGRSSSATQLLESQGFDVINMSGGMLSWEGDIE